MRSHFTIDSMYHVYTQEQNLQDMAEVALEVWEGQLQSIEPAKRQQKTAKMLNLAGQMPHPQFGAFAQAIADTAQARASRKIGNQKRLSVPVPVPSVLLRETDMQRLIRNLDLQGIVLGGLCETLKLETPEDESLWLYAQIRLVGRMKQAGLPQQCDAQVATFAKEGWGIDVMKQCVDWLNVGALNGLLAHVFAQLGRVWAQVAEDEKAHKAPPKLTVAQMAELQPTRVLLRVLGIAGLRELAFGKCFGGTTQRVCDPTWRRHCEPSRGNAIACIVRPIRKGRRESFFKRDVFWHAKAGRADVLPCGGVCAKARTRMDCGRQRMYGSRSDSTGRSETA
jgi:hypothetical protein